MSPINGSPSGKMSKSRGASPEPAAHPGMKKQTIRTAVSVVALAAAAVAPNGADAKAKRTQRSNDQVELRRDLDSAQEQISELRAEVNALRAKLDQQSTAQSQTASNAQAAETKADQAL